VRNNCSFCGGRVTKAFAWREYIDNRARLSLTFGGGLGKLKVEGRRMYDGSDSGSQSMAAEAGADKGWIFMEGCRLGISLVRVVMLKIKRRGWGEDASVEKF